MSWRSELRCDELIERALRLLIIRFSYRRLGYQADIAYNIALCHYKLEQTQQAMKKVSSSAS